MFESLLVCGYERDVHGVVVFCVAGSIPESLGQLGNLQRLNLDGNKLTGECRYVC